MSDAVKDGDPNSLDDAPVGSDAWAKAIYDKQIASLLELAEIGRTILKAVDAGRVAEVARAMKRGELATSEAAVRSETAYQKSRRRIIREIDASLAQALGMMERGDRPLQ